MKNERSFKIAAIFFSVFFFVVASMWTLTARQAGKLNNVTVNKESAIVDNVIQSRSQSESSSPLPENISKSDEGDEHLTVRTYPLGEHYLTFGLSVPRIWRATLEKNINQEYTSVNDSLAIINFLSPYVPHTDDSGLMPESQLGFYDVTEWIAKNTEAADGLGGTQKASDKKEYFDSLIDLRKSKNPKDFSKCDGAYEESCQGVERTYVE